MNTKPATPLPWIDVSTGPRMAEEYSQPLAIAQSGASNLIAGVFGDVLGGEKAAETNAAYIVHACNAYPELVAALQRTSTALGLAYSKKPLRDMAETLAEANSLLARLGEDK